MLRGKPLKSSEVSKLTAKSLHKTLLALDANDERAHFISIEGMFRLSKVKLSADRLTRRKLCAPRPAVRLSFKTSAGKTLFDAISKSATLKVQGPPRHRLQM